MSPITSNGKKESGYARVLGSGASGESLDEDEGEGEGAQERGGSLAAAPSSLPLAIALLGQLAGLRDSGECLGARLGSQSCCGSYDQGANELLSLFSPSFVEQVSPS